MSKKITFASILALTLLLFLNPGYALAQTPGTDFSAAYEGKAVDDTGNVANLVIYVNFADTVHSHSDNSTTYGECFETNPNLTALFQGDPANPNAYPFAMKQYLSNISYGKLQVANIFPQYDTATETIHPYTLSGTLNDYASMPDSGDAAIVKEISDILAVSGQISSDISLDRDNDGCIDNLMIIVPCESGNSNSKFYGHMASYPGSDALVNGKYVSAYTIIPESSAYLGLSQSGVLVHEFLHTIGYPDLYLRTNTSGSVPVGRWDIMAAESYSLQYPLAYLRACTPGSNWFTIPTLTDSRQGYSLYAASAATETTKDQQAVILKTDYSSSEFFVLEYRKKRLRPLSGLRLCNSGIRPDHIPCKYSRNIR